MSLPGYMTTWELEDILAPNSMFNMYARDTSQGGSAYDQYRVGGFNEPEQFKTYTKALIENSYKSMGHGSNSNILQNFVSRLDRHGRVLVPMNSLNYGYTFITRPRLNLSGMNLSLSSLLSGLYSADPKSLAFMIRGLLDTRLCSGQPVYGKSQDNESKEFADKAAASGLIDAMNPFLVPVCNALKGISGYPDFTLDTETTEGDFYSSDYTFARGSDMNWRSTELSLEFRDTPGSIVLAIFYYWAYYIALQARGVVESYQDDIYQGLLNYTFSIYRFVTDQSRKRINHWSKATGCIVKSIPIGAIFNISQGETFITSAANFSIPVAVNKIEYNIPDILKDFNVLMRRYCPYITDGSMFYSLSNRNTADYNFMGLPYIVETKTGIELDWRTTSLYHDNLMNDEAIEKATQQLNQTKTTNINQHINALTQYR